MKLVPIVVAALALGLAPAGIAGTLHYEGTLADGGAPARGHYGFRLTPYDAERGGRALASPVEFAEVAVVDGEFSLETDFGAATEREKVWLGVEVGDGRGEWHALDERVALATAGGACWLTTGNAAVGGAHLLGTTDAVDLRIGVNGLPRVTVRNNRGVALGFTAVAPGLDAFAAGNSVSASGAFAASLNSGNSAGGDNSFVGGTGATVRDRAAALDGGLCPDNSSCGDEASFVWGGELTGMATTGPRQFLIGANGGVAINRAPVDDDVELTIEGRTNDNFLGNVDLVMVPSANGTSGEGIAFATGRGAGGANDATFTVAQRNDGAFVTRFMIDGDGTTRNTTGAWTTLSDRRLKRDIASIDSPLARLLALRGREFAYIAAAGMAAGRRYGFVAQEVRESIPQWVSEGSDGYLTVTPAGFEALTVEAVREIAHENAALRADNAALAARLARLEAAVLNGSGAR
jgi:hypothetical protein